MSAACTVVGDLALVPAGLAGRPQPFGGLGRGSHVIRPDGSGRSPEVRSPGPAAYTERFI